MGYAVIFGPDAAEELAGNIAAIPHLFFTTALVGLVPA
jgi:hypothetical protein